MNAVDANILIYSQDFRDLKKQQAAERLVRSLRECVLLWQVACEYLSASRKLVSQGFDHQQAWDDISEPKELWQFSAPNWKVLVTAQSLRTRYSLSHWDSLIVAHCNSIGVKRLYSEDMGGSDNIDGLEIINPFAE